jgi:mRNA-decapping enzyme subunit 2
VERICFQVEEAQWFYEDFIRPLDPALPSLTLKAFALRIFQHCPLMSQWSHYHHMTAFSEFLAYKTRVPVRGAIMLNQEMDEVVLVKGWKKGANWSFPRGKINKGEPDLDCAIREVYEETGFDVREAGLVKNDDNVKYIEITMREQHMRLYVFPGVPKDTHFEPRTRKEISKIEWYKLSELPTLKKSKQHDEGLAVANANKFYMVAPFLNPLKKWISQQKKVAPKTQAGISLVEGYVSMDENGQQAGSTRMQAAIPSELPEVTTAHDASSHLKQLLNIGAIPLAMQAPQPVQPVQAPAVDKSKSDALLGLLRSGSQDTAPHLQNRAMPFSNSTYPGAPSAAQPAHLAPNFFPGFPQQQQHMAPSNFTQQTSTVLPQGRPHSNGRPANNPAQHGLGQGFPPAAQHELSGSAAPRFPQTPGSHFYNNPLQSPPSNFAPPRHVAPFQATGDPQFSHSTQPSQVPGARVPPASKLPPPKLTSQSQALLDVFKGNTFNTAKSPHATPLSIPGKGQPQVRQTSQHQEGLLGLFKGPRAMPAELGGHPVPAAPSSEKQILQRPSPHPDPSLQRGSNALMTAGGSTQTSATVSGPMAMPQLDSLSKQSPKKGTNSSNRRNQSGRREPSQPQQLSSPITILPRPQSAKRDTSTSVPRPPVHQAPSQAQAQGQAPQTEAPEPVKPFQPQILRRSEKVDYEEFLMNSSKMESAGRKPSLTGLQTNTSDLAPQTSFDRRPSQNAAQKDALLALFGKASSPSPIQLDSRSANQHPSTISGLVSPLSSFHLPSSGGSLSRHGTPTAFEGDMNPPSSTHIASPSNKEFLLGYLQGVAKGNN